MTSAPATKTSTPANLYLSLHLQFLLLHLCIAHICWLDVSSETCEKVLCLPSARFGADHALLSETALAPKQCYKMEKPFVTLINQTHATKNFHLEQQTIPLNPGLAEDPMDELSARRVWLVPPRFGWSTSSCSLVWCPTNPSVSSCPMKTVCKESPQQCFGSEVEISDNPTNHQILLDLNANL